MNAIQPVRRNSPSVIASIPALSWSAIASSTALSSSARSSPASNCRPARRPLPPVGTRAAAGCRRRPLSPWWWPPRRDYKVPPMREVEGKVAFITGGGSGVGLGMARAFLGAGMKVAIADIRTDHLEEATAELGGDVHAIQLDVTDREAFARAADETERVSRQRARPLQQRRHQPLQRHRRRDLPGLGLGARRQPRRRRQRRRHLRAEDQGARRARARRQHRVDGSVRRRRRARASTRPRSSPSTACRMRSAGA